MKQLLLTSFFLVSGFSAVHAGNNLSQTANDSAMAAGRLALTAKISQFSSNASTSASSTATLQTANELLDLMRNGMSQTKRNIELSSSMTAAQAINAHYLKMEKASNMYFKLLPTISSDHSEMLKQARTFSSEY